MKISRAPLVVLIAGLGLAAVLVLLGGRLAVAPAPAPALGSPGTLAEPRTVNVIMRDYRFDPTPLHLVAGETVRLNIVNGGLVDHELVLGDAGVQRAWREAHARATPPAPFATPPPASAAPGTAGLRVWLPSGGSTTTVHEVRPGDLQLWCHIPGHAERGMIGLVELVTR